MRVWIAAIIGAALATGAAIAADEAPDQLLGQWYTEDNESKVEVVKKDGKYFGTIIWLSEPNYGPDEEDTGKPKRDKNNPDKTKQHDPVIGIQVLKNFSYVAGEKTWEGGTIYDPNNGRTYKCVIRFQNDPKGVDGKSLHVRGYIGIPTLGRTTIWYRVPKDEMEPSTAEATE
jgi:uncharacterized protein (DUF2147 family)